MRELTNLSKARFLSFALSVHVFVNDLFQEVLTQRNRSPHPIDKERLRLDQLAFRQAEVEETVRVLRALNDGKGAELHRDNPRREGVDLKRWEGYLDLDAVTLAGHSYGATLAVSQPIVPFIHFLCLRSHLSLVTRP